MFPCTIRMIQTISRVAMTIRAMPIDHLHGALLQPVRPVVRPAPRASCARDVSGCDARQTDGGDGGGQ